MLCIYMELMLCGGLHVQCGYTDVFILGCFVCIYTEICRCVYRLKPMLHARMVGLCALGEVPYMGPFLWCEYSGLYA